MRFAVAIVMLSLAAPALADAVAQGGQPAPRRATTRRVASPANLPTVEVYKEAT